MKEDATAPAPPARRRVLLPFVSFLGLVSLSFLLGAAVIFFEWPPSSFLRKAFVGGATWYERRPGATPHADSLPPLSVGQIDKPDKTCDGFTLLMYGGARAVLVNMRGEVVHRWQLRFSDVWSDPPHLRGRIDDAEVYFNDGHVYPNGDLLVVLEGPISARNPSNGYGLARLDRDSHVLWKYAGKCHHDVDVGEDGTIYAITNEFVDKVPAALADFPTPCMTDYIDVISPEGKGLKRISLLEAVGNSPYAPLLCMIERPRRFAGMAAPDGLPSPAQEEQRRLDVLHTNAVKVLTRELAPKFPMLKAGQLLVSLRSLDAIAAVDPDSGQVVWAARGPWRAQHDPSFLANGHLLLFDNLGSPRGSRVLEYDPKTQAFPWSYPAPDGAPFLSRIRGMTQRLANGNTLVVNSDGGEAFEVTPGREVVWSCSCGRAELNRARRYAPKQLPFLKEGPRGRP